MFDDAFLNVDENDALVDLGASHERPGPEVRAAVAKYLNP
jgi:hypothetical protein